MPNKQQILPWCDFGESNFVQEIKREFITRHFEK